MTTSAPAPIDIPAMIEGILSKSGDMKDVFSDVRHIAVLAGNETLDESTKRQAKMAEALLKQFTHGVEEHPQSSYQAAQAAWKVFQDNATEAPEARLSKTVEAFNASFSKLAAEHGHHHDHDHIDEEGRKIWPRGTNDTWLEEMKIQVKEQWGNKKGWGGKTMMIAGTTACGAVMVHAGVNIKRGLFGYTDPESGEKKQGSISNLLVGAFEGTAAALLGKRILTGNFKFTRGQGK